jgi:hypothetical protein
MKEDEEVGSAHTTRGLVAGGIKQARAEPTEVEPAVAASSYVRQGLSQAI